MTGMAGLCEGRVCIVTGAGGGIGREHALLLAAHGAKVVVNDLGGAMDGDGRSDGPGPSGGPTRSSPPGARPSPTPTTSPTWDGAKRLVHQAVDTFGRLDVLVNNAGILRDRMLVNMTEDEWDAVIRVHLKGTFAPARHAAAHWRDRSKAGEEVDARIINTTSVSGIYGNPGQTNYGAAKMGIAAFTIIAAQELARYGVTVNAIAPGALTRMTEGLGMGGAETDRASSGAAMSPAVDRPDLRVAGVAAVPRASPAGCSRSSGAMLAVAEGWHRGPTTEPILDPEAIGPVARGPRRPGPPQRRHARPGQAPD